MKPYLVNRELAPNLDELSKTEPTQLEPGARAAAGSAAAGDDGSRRHRARRAPAQPAAIPGVVVGGKTGTADTGRKLKNGQDEPPDAWFIGYAMVNGVAKIAVAVLIENGGVQGNETTGGQAAAPVAKAVMEAYLKGHGGG